MAVSTLCQRTPQKYLQQDTCTDKRGGGGAAAGACNTVQIFLSVLSFFGAQAACASPTCGCPAALTVLTCRAEQDSSAVLESSHAVPMF